MKAKILQFVFLAFFSLSSQAYNIINTIAGGGPDNIPALSANVVSPTGITTDSAGQLYISANHRIYKVDTTGLLIIVAGSGVKGFSGDNGPAPKAALDDPQYISLDSAGNLYIADLRNHRIRRVDAITGVITTVAGNGTQGFSGDGGLAIEASLNFPYGVSADSLGNLFIADYANNRIRRVDVATGIISTVVGNGTASYSGDGGLAIEATLSRPTGVILDSGGNLYISDDFNSRIRRVDTATGIITTVAGNGSRGFSGDGGLAINARIGAVRGINVDSGGNLFFSEPWGQRVRRVDAMSGIITTVAGTGDQGFSGDGVLATYTRLNYPQGVIIDSDSNLIIADRFNNRIRKVDAATGVITTAVGNGSYGSSDDIPATSSGLAAPHTVSVDSEGNLFIADRASHRIRRVDATTGIITRVAGSNGTRGFSGDDGPATSASLSSPYGISFDSTGNLYIADSSNHCIRRIDATTGVITTVAGRGAGGDDGPAISARLQYPVGVTIDNSDNLYIAEFSAQRIRRIDATTGVITTVAGNGTRGFSGDGGPATNASLNGPFAVSVDNSDNLYITDRNNHRIRRVDAITGFISTVAGNGTEGFSGDSVPATSTSLALPHGVSIDNEDNLLIADSYNNRIRRVDATTGIISTVVGNGSYGFSGDGGEATIASLASPTHVFVASSGNLYITDSGNNRIRIVTTGTDIDGDGLGDLNDPCPDDATNTCDPDMSASGEFSEEGGYLVTPDQSVTVNIPQGALDSGTVLTITETSATTGTAPFELTTNLGAAIGVFGVEINPEGAVFNTPITLVFTWDDADSDGKVDGTNIQEKNLRVTKDGVAITGKCNAEPVGGALPDCDMDTNTFTFQVSSLSVFVLAFVDDEPPVIADMAINHNPVGINIPLTLTATLNDLNTGNSDIDVAEYRIDGGAFVPMYAQDGTLDSAEEVVTADLSAFSGAGIHSLCVRGQDAQGNGYSAEQCILLAVYDPDAGFITGGGWFHSPPGAYTADPTLEGKATFGFISKYKKGKNTPDGNTQFQFKAADLNFHSNSYDWLVVAGARGQFKGQGTVNGQEGHGFMITAIDGDLNGGGNNGDKFRIKIWEKATDTVIYDNQLAAPDGAEPSTVIQHGSIIIHTK